MVFIKSKNIFNIMHIKISQWKHERQERKQKSKRGFILSYQKRCLEHDSCCCFVHYYELRAYSTNQSNVYIVDCEHVITIMVRGKCIFFTYFTSIVHLCTLWRCQETFRGRGYRNTTLVWNGLNEQTKEQKTRTSLYLFQALFSFFFFCVLFVFVFSFEEITCIVLLSLF